LEGWKDTKKKNGRRWKFPSAADLQAQFRRIPPRTVAGLKPVHVMEGNVNAQSREL
jgi:hypothetical protein